MLDDQVVDRRGSKRGKVDGPTALLSRLSAFHIAAPLFRLLRADKDLGRRVPWDKPDLSEPDCPKLTGDLDARPRLSQDG